jgi:hypothetical protein
VLVLGLRGRAKVGSRGAGAMTGGETAGVSAMTNAGAIEGPGGGMGVDAPTT